MSKFSKLVGAALVAASFSVSAGVLDSFTDTQAVSTTATGVWVEAAQVSDVSGTIFGGYREIGVMKTSGGATRAVTADVNVDPGLYTFSSDIGTRGIGKIRYDGAVDSSLAAGPDLTSNLGSLTALGAGVVFTYDTDLSFSVEIEIWDTSGNSVYGVFLTTPNPSPGFLSETVLWTDLDPTMLSIDWNNIAAIDVTLNGVTDTTRIDLSVKAVEYVPEPGILGLMGFGLFGLGLARRRKA